MRLLLLPALILTLGCFGPWQVASGQSPAAPKPQADAASLQMEENLREIVLPTVQLQGATLEEAIEVLRILVNHQCKWDENSNKKRRWVSLIIQPSKIPSRATITVDLHDVPLGKALRDITELADMKFQIEKGVVFIRPAY